VPLRISGSWTTTLSFMTVNNHQTIRNAKALSAQDRGLVGVSATPAGLEFPLILRAARSHACPPVSSRHSALLDGGMPTLSPITSKPASQGRINRPL
jgi:hypothetical protein